MPEARSQSGSDSIPHVARTALYVLAFGLLAAAATMAYLAWADEARFAADQTQLSAALPASVPATAAAETTGALDFTGWAESDVAYWKTLRTGGPFARIVAPAAGIDDIAVKGAGERQLDVAPGWIVQTDMPGPEGNCAISGHRVTHGRPFRRLDRLKIGATIYLYSPYRRYRYQVDAILRVTPDHVEVIAHTVVPHLTLTTCDPPGRAVKRLVVQARLVEAVRLSGPGAGTLTKP